MENATCNVFYVNKRAKDEVVRRDSFGHQSEAADADPIRATLISILSTFSSVQVFSTGSSCLSKLSVPDLALTEPIPTLVLIDIPYEEEQRLKRLSREASIFRRPNVDDDTDIYGIQLLSHIHSEINSKKLPKLIIPIALVSPQRTPSEVSTISIGQDDTSRLMRFMDAGAVDVVTTPVSQDRIQALAAHAYRVFKDVTKSDAAFLSRNRSRKMSWVGVEEDKPYAYLRESMVSSLMNGICSPETDLTPAISDFINQGSSDPFSDWESHIPADRRIRVSKAVGSWSFSAHDFTDDELVYGALAMLNHAVQVEELSKWRLNKNELFIFLQACRVSYNDFVHYHNFRHVVDVLQALFSFLVSIGSLPPYSNDLTPQKTPLSSLITSFEALTLLISAVGHDVGHPGVNNAFLVTLNSPLAQLYNDRSVLESFHCAAYSQILRRHWPAVFKDAKMRRLMINSILATDMGLHFKYMIDMKKLRGEFAKDKEYLQTVDDPKREELRDLICGLLIKCADISNVARVFECARIWANILTEEFAHQGTMEVDLGIKSCLFGGPPVLGNIVKLGESQLGFMTVFAGPLFEGISALMPRMSYTIEELDKNRKIWDKMIADNKSNSTSEVSYTESNTNSKSTPHTSVDPTDLRSPSTASSANGQISLSSQPVTSTALPLQQIMEGFDSDAAKRGRLPRKDTSVDPLSSAPKSQSPNSRQRAVSAHQSSSKGGPPSDQSTPPLPNGMNPGFAASETDVRYLGKDRDLYLRDNGSAAGDDPRSRQQNGKRFSAGLKRFFKKRWRNDQPAGGSPIDTTDR